LIDIVFTRGVIDHSFLKTSDEEAEIIDGKGKISFTTKPGAYNKNGLTEKKFMTYITMNDSTYEYEHTYFVVKPIYKIQSAAISSLYLNCGNELMVYVPALGTSYNPNFKTTGAINIKGAKNGQVTIIPNAPKVTLIVSSNGRVIGTEHFTAMKVPNPRCPNIFQRKTHQHESRSKGPGTIFIGSERGT